MQGGLTRCQSMFSPWPCSRAKNGGIEEGRQNGQGGHNQGHTFFRVVKVNRQLTLGKKRLSYCPVGSYGKREGVEKTLTGGGKAETFVSLFLNEEGITGGAAYSKRRGNRTLSKKTIRGCRRVNCGEKKGVTFSEGKEKGKGLLFGEFRCDTPGGL